jgi:hypothetical protein
MVRATKQIPVMLTLHCDMNGCDGEMTKTMHSIGYHKEHRCLKCGAIKLIENDYPRLIYTDEEYEYLIRQLDFENMTTEEKIDKVNLMIGSLKSLGWELISTFDNIEVPESIMAVFKKLLVKKEKLEVI